MVAKKRGGLGRGLAELLGEGASTLAQPTPARIARKEHTRSEASGVAAPQTGVSPRDASAPDAAVILERAVVGPTRPGIIDVSVAAIRPNPRQPRRSFDAEALEELARSIDALGMVQPVIVRPLGEGYELIAGERRWRAAQRAGFTVIPAILREASDVESLEIALVENVVRQQLNPVDEAYAFQVLLDDLGVTQEMLAGRIGKSRSAIANKVRLLELPSAVQELLVAGSLSEGHGRALLGLKARGDQLRLARKAADKGLSVRVIEAEVRRLMEREERPVQLTPQTSSLSPELLDSARDAFYGSTGVVPSLRLQGAGGRIELRFRDAAELEQIVGRITSRPAAAE